MKSIYEIYVTVTSQEQADRLKAICVKYGLPIWESGFQWLEGAYEYLVVSCGWFWVNSKFGIINKTPITESEFLELAKEFKQ
jgi:hypothetical protein